MYLDLYYMKYLRFPVSVHYRVSYMKYLPFPVPLDKGNGGSGDEISPSKDSWCTIYDALLQGFVTWHKGKTSVDLTPSITRSWVLKSWIMDGRRSPMVGLLRKEPKGMMLSKWWLFQSYITLPSTRPEKA